MSCISVANRLLVRELQVDAWNLPMPTCNRLPNIAAACASLRTFGPNEDAVLAANQWRGFAVAIAE
jgi:hypothetical protein